MIIKFSSNSGDFPFLRQTPQGGGRWGDCEFKQERELDRADFWVVYEGMDQPESCAVDPRNTLLVMAEPPPVKRYHPTFVKQFAHVITVNGRHRGRRFHHSQPALPWLIGWDGQGANPNVPSDYDTWKSLPIPKKSGLLSVIISNKAITRGHRNRIAFVERLKQHFGDRLHLYGRGFRSMPDKWEAVAPYEYHVVLENTICRNYWTEKLSDAYLGWTFPFYSGCPNIGDYLSTDAMQVIDRSNPEASINTIEECIRKDSFRMMESQIRSARNDVLEKHNLFAMLARFIRKQVVEADHSSRYHIEPEESFAGLVHRVQSRLHRLYHSW